MSITQWKNLTPTQLLALKGLGGEQGVYVRSSMIRALKGDGSAAILLTQLVYWSQSDMAKKSDGWFYLTTQKISQDLGISRYIQERVRTMLVEMGILEYERRGMPAKNYYRVALDQVISLVAAEFYVDDDDDDAVGGKTPNKSGPNPPTSTGENPQHDGGNTPDIVNTSVKIYSKQAISPTSGRRNAKIEPVNVLGQDFDKYLAGVRKTYPLNGQGLPVTENQARRALKKFGDLKPVHTEEERKAAQIRVATFVRALKNIRKAVDLGEQESKYVPGFDRFAGLGVSYVSEPAYVAWAEKVFVEKKQKLVV